MRVKKISEVIGSKVYTDSGDYFGEVEEANLHENKVDGWRIKEPAGLLSSFINRPYFDLPQCMRYVFL